MYTIVVICKFTTFKFHIYLLSHYQFHAEHFTYNLFTVKKKYRNLASALWPSTRVRPAGKNRLKAFLEYVKFLS